MSKHSEHNLVDCKLDQQALFDITIVVCTYNRAEMLREALSSLTVLKTERPITTAPTSSFTYEILVIDNASTDETATVVEEIAAQTTVPIRRVLEQQQGVVHARNCGVREANSEWIAFFDDDQLADPQWLQNLLSMANKKQVRCVGGAVYLQLPAGENRQLAPVCRMLLGETIGMETERTYNHRVTPGTGNLLVHRTVFDEIGCFNPEFHQRGEDTDLFLRMLDAGNSAWFTPHAIVHHIIPAERLEADYLKRLASLLVEGLAEDERRAWGKVWYPLIWAARVGQAAFILIPRFLLAWICRDRERTLGETYRLYIARCYLADGWSLMRSPTSPI